MHQLSQKQLENQVSQFNESYKVGNKVIVMLHADGGESFVDEIRHEATIMGGHTAVTWLKSKGSYDLTFVIGKV